jgi:hypothetical protein
VAVKHDLSQAERETAIRVLGAADGYASMLIRVRSQIANVMSERIDERHTRKLAARDQILRPLVALRDHCETQHRECSNAYKRRMAGENH